MPDYCDRSAAASDALFKAAMSKATQMNVDDVENLYCQECGEEIPEARRRAVYGCRLCVDCQEIEEQS